MIIVTIILLIGFCVAFPIMLNANLVEFAPSINPSFSGATVATSPKISDVIGVNSVIGFALIMLLIGVGAILCTVCKRKEFIALGIISSIVPNTIFLTQIISKLQVLNKTNLPYYDVSGETIVTIVLLGLIALYSVVLGLARLIIYIKKVKKAI